MILFKQMELLNRMHQLIEQSHTGTPKYFAKRLGISERRLYEVIDEMKSLGAPINYSRDLKTYYYMEDFEMSISFTFRRLSSEEQQETWAGTWNNKSCFNFYITAFFVQ